MTEIQIPNRDQTRFETYSFTNVNEDGVEYDHHTNIVDALDVLDRFPNDTIVVRVVRHPAKEAEHETNFRPRSAGGEREPR